MKIVYFPKYFLNSFDAFPIRYIQKIDAMFSLTNKRIRYYFFSIAFQEILIHHSIDLNIHLLFQLKSNNQKYIFKHG